MAEIQSTQVNLTDFKPITSLSQLAPEPPFVRANSGDHVQVLPHNFALKAKGLMEAFGAVTQRDHTLIIPQPDIVISTKNKDQMQRDLAKVNVMYFDMDGTVVKEGSTEFDTETIEQLRRCRNAGVTIVLGPSGKPLEEFLPALRTLPADLDVCAILEKGAYRLERSKDGEWNKTYLLTTSEMEASMTQLRDRFYAKADEIANLPGTSLSTIGARLEAEFQVVLIPAGSGAHESVLSFDILHAGSSRDFRNYVPGQRDTLKITDHDLAKRLVSRLAEMMAKEDISGLTHATIRDMNNFNIEVHDSRVDKNHAVRADILARGSSVEAMTVGDGPNDTPMLSLPAEMPNVQSCLVLHNPKSADLTKHVDYVVIGPNNAKAICKRVADAKEASLKTA